MTALLFTLPLLISAEPGRQPLCIITSLQPAYSIALNLVKNTPIEIVYIPAEDCGMEDQSAYFKEAYHTESFKKIALKADAVLTLKSIWKNDPLYTYTALHNIFAVPLDIAEPLNPAIAGVSTLKIPTAREGFEAGRFSAGNGEVLPSIWLSLSNGAKMTEIIADSLIRMAPAYRPAIQNNRDNYLRHITALQTEYEEKLLEADIGSVALLSPDYIYLTGNFNLYVSDYLFKDGYDYTKADLMTLQNLIVSGGTEIFIASSASETIVSCITESGGIYIELEALSSPVPVEGTPADIYLSVMRHNLESLYQAALILKKM